MKIQNQFIVSRPLAVVWQFFHEAPKVAACLPGAEYLGSTGDDTHKGRVSVKVGPFQANFEGEAKVTYQEEAKMVRLDGKGVDRKGASRGRMVMDCRLSEQGAATLVDVEADVQLSGNIAQFGRTGLIKEVANILTADFVRNAEAALAAAPAASSGLGDVAASARPIRGLALLLAILRAWIRRLFARQV